MSSSQHVLKHLLSLAAACLVAALAALALPALAHSARAAAAADPAEPELAQLQAVTAGAGTVTISPGEDGTVATCQTVAQQVNEGDCTHGYPLGTRVTITALPGASSFLGWSDYTCPNTSRTCTLTMTGERFITARFSAVELTIQGSAFGDVSVTPAPGGLCVLTPDSFPCTFPYRSGTVVSLRRQRPAPDLSWVGACEGNTAGLLDADVCRIRLQDNELVGAGYDNVGSIPPAIGSSLQVVLAGKTRGRVTGRVVNSNRTLSCGSRCTISGLKRYDTIRLTATRLKGGRFVGWSDGSRLTQRIIQLSSVNKIKATFKAASAR